MRIHSLGYVGVASPAADEWLAMGPGVFGLEAYERSDSGGERVVRVCWDDRAGTVVDSSHQIGLWLENRQQGDVAGVMHRIGVLVSEPE